MEALRAKDTSLSKERAHEMVNGAWKTHLAKSCGSSQLAVALLRHPPTVVHTLLESWQQYMLSDQLRSERERESA